MAVIKNPVTVGNKGTVNSTITFAMTLNSPAEVLIYLNEVISEMPELQSGRFYAINKKNWALGSANRMCFFNIEDGAVGTDTAIRISTGGNLSARAFSTTNNLTVMAGDTFEIIRVVEE